MARVRATSLAVHRRIVAYDIQDDRVRARVARFLESIGNRKQYSVFDCRLDEREFRNARGRISALIDRHNDDVRWYPQCGHCRSGSAGPMNREIDASAGGFWVI